MSGKAAFQLKNRVDEIERKALDVEKKALEIDKAVAIKAAQWEEFMKNTDEFRAFLMDEVRALKDLPTTVAERIAGLECPIHGEKLSSLEKKISPEGTITKRLNFQQGIIFRVLSYGSITLFGICFSAGVMFQIVTTHTEQIGEIGVAIHSHEMRDLNEIRKPLIKKGILYDKSDQEQLRHRVP